MLFQDLKNRIRQVCLGAEFDVVPDIPGNLTEKFIQVLGQFRRWEAVILDMVFLLEDESIQAGTEDFNGRLIKLLGEHFSIEVGIILNKSGPSPQPPGNDRLRDFEQKQISFLQVLPIGFEDMKILGRLTIFLQKQAIKGVVDFKEREMLEVLG
jgi:hypothetical protein